MKNLTVSVVGMAAVVGSSAFAAEGTFQNHLTSPIMVSPTQILQVQDTKTDFSVGYSLKTDTSKLNGKSSEGLDSSTDVFAGGIFNIKSIGLRAGLTAAFKSMEQEMDEKSTMAGTEVTVSPQAAYAAGPIVLGAAMDVIQKSAKPEDDSELKADYIRLRPGVAFANDLVEAGIVYASPTRKEELDTLTVMEPAQVTLHGRFSVNPEIALGGIVTNNNYKPINEEAFNDQLILKGTGEYQVSNFKVEGNVGYSTAYYENKEEDLSEDTIALITVGAAGDYTLNQMASVGASANYDFGSDSNKSLEVAKNTVSVALRGNVKF